MDINYYKSLEPFFGKWSIKRFLGEGSFGCVFEVERVEDQFGRTYTATI